MFLGIPTYLALLRVFKVDEMDFLFSALKRRLIRRPRDAGNGDGPAAEPVDVTPMTD